MANVVSGSFTASGQSASFAPKVSPRDANSGAFNIALTGTAVAAVQLEKSFDNGQTWCELWAGGVQLKEWSYSNAGSGPNIAETYEEIEAGVLYRLNCTWTSGTLAYRLSQS